MKQFMMRESENSPEISVEYHDIEDGEKSQKSRVVEDWKLSYNECNLTNYTKFGVKRGSMKSQNKRLSSQGMPTTRLGQTFFNRRMHL